MEDHSLFAGTVCNLCGLDKRIAALEAELAKVKADHEAALAEAVKSRDMAYNLAELRAEDIECVHLCLDRLNIPRATLTETYSVWGRVECAIKAAVAKEREVWNKWADAVIKDLEMRARLHNDDTIEISQGRLVELDAIRARSDKSRNAMAVSIAAQIKGKP